MVLRVPCPAEHLTLVDDDRFPETIMKAKAKPNVDSMSDDVVLLEDLAPIRDVRGGAGKLRFGQSLPVNTVGAGTPDEESATPSAARNPTPRRNG